MKTTDNFNFISNDSALDFLNTVIHVDGVPVDLLKDAEALKLWFHKAGFECDEAISTQTFQEAIKLRHAIRVLTQSSEQNPDADRMALACLNTYITRALSPAPLVRKGQSYTFEPRQTLSSAADHLREIAQQAAKLLTETQPKHIRTCANDKCVLMFKDASRAQRRKWCRMETCGNRAKVASHYKRSQTEKNIQANP